MRWHLYWPRYNVNGYPCDPLDLTSGQTAYYSEVKTYPSICIGPKPGYYGPGAFPAFSFVVRTKDGAPNSDPPQYSPGPIATDWQTAGGTPSSDSPSGNTYGDGLKLPLQLPLTNQTAKIRGRIKEFMTPTGRGHLSYDIWLCQTATQIKGHPQSSMTHELMIPMRFWGGYGRFGNRNPGWYIGDVTIDGVLYHVYATKDSPVSDVNGTVDGHGDVTSGANNWYSGLRYNFGGLDPVNGFINEETGQPRIGWKLIVFEFDAPNGTGGQLDVASHPVDANGYHNIDLSKFTAYLAGKLDSRGVPFIRNAEYLTSIELGIEKVWGECDIAAYDFKMLPSTSIATMPALPTYSNTAPTNHLPVNQSFPSGTAFAFVHSAGNQIWVVDKDNDVLTTTVSVPAASGVFNVTAGSGATVTGNGTGNVQLVGTPAAINAALNGMTYTYAGTGSVTLTIATNDGTAATVTNTMTLTAQSANNSPALLATQFGSPNNNGGIWLENILSDMSTDPTTRTAPTSWTGGIARWYNHGAANGHDFIEANSAQNPLIGTDSNGKGWVQIYVGEQVTGAGGSTTGFYACFVADWQSYYGTLFSDQDVAYHGVRLYQSADYGQWVFSAGNGTTYKTVTLSNGLALYTTGIGKVVVECWFDGTNLNLRVNKGTVATAAMGSTTITAGNANMEFNANWANADCGSNNSYGGVILRNYVPSSSDRDAYASYFGAKANLTI
jgi:hypothetical protein